MASVAGRKSSIISSAGPVANNTLLNKAASQSTSLYQQCSSLRSRLMRIRGFSHYFSLATTPDSRQSTDPVTQLWDLFSLGIPLCYIFDLLPAEQGFNKINNSQFNPEEYETNPDRLKKHAIALFAIQIGSDKVMLNIPGCERFTVRDLWDRNSTDGLVKVINTVTAIVDHLPEDTFESPPPSPPSLAPSDSLDSFSSDGATASPANAQESARNNIIREMVETERKYVQDLEIMQKYSNALAQGNIIDQDTIHLLFPNLNKLLNFQRKFLIRFESTAELPWQNQRWGQHFLDCEEEFVVYEPYCANYTSATELMLANEQHLSALNHLINVRGELPAFLIKPIQRVCKYPLLLDSLIKATSADGYQHFDELKRGSEAAKRITDKINEAQRRAENELTVKNLESRIKDWKGHHLANFGSLLLDDIFVVTKSEIDREYHVFLFEKIILCCKEAPEMPPNSKGKVGKSNSLLKKQPAPPPLTLPGGVGQPIKKNTPLLLKGRIFLGNVTQAVPVSARSSSNPSLAPHYPLAVWWKGDDDLEFFTLRCRTEDQRKQWEAQINRLIKESAQRRASERSAAAMSRVAMASAASHGAASMTSQPRLQSKQTQSPYSAPQSVYPTQPSSVSMSSVPSSRGPRTPYGNDEHVVSLYSTSSSSGPQGYPPADGFEFEPDDDDFEDYPPSSSYAPSGRGTPIAMSTTSSTSIAGGVYRRNNAYSMPPERDAVPGYDRPRAQTEDAAGAIMAQWRSNNGLPPLPAQPPEPTMRPPNPRMNSNMSAGSYASDSSFGTGISQTARSSRPALRTQLSQTRLRNGYESAGAQGMGAGVPSSAMPNSLASSQPIPNHAPHRSRSASQPVAYVPKTEPPPPLPTQQWSRERANTSAMNAGMAVGTGMRVNVRDKRESGSSQSTGGDSSDYSPNSSSPVTPFGSSESSLGAGMGIRTSRSQHFDSMHSNGATVHIHAGHNGMNGMHGGMHGMGMNMTGLNLNHQTALSSPVKVKVHFHEDIFVIQVARSTEYDDLVEKVGRKIRLCGPRRDDGPLRVKYRDEDGDMISLGSTEDVQMAFEQYRPGGQVTLFVT